uniref:Uncharacterized protein n=1 Tax=Biomphalaria glabrata TaxID=6526 RepID=A0A2C9LT61_BIOGL
MSLTDHLFSEADSRLVVHSAPSSRGDSSLYDKVHFDFYTKTLHAAHDALLQTRSSHFRRRPAEQDKDIWKRKPPDFRYVVYDPHPPKRNTVDSMQPWRYGTIPGQREIIKRVRSEGHLPRLLEDDSNDEGTQFKTQFRLERPFTAKKKFVASGSNKPGEYESPKPHDFRGYPPIKSLGLDEFVTDYEKDPNGVKFKTQRLNHMTPFPSDTIPSDTIPSDTIPSDTIFSDTIPSDTIPPVTPFPVTPFPSDTIHSDTIHSDTIPPVTPFPVTPFPQ